MDLNRTPKKSNELKRSNAVDYEIDLSITMSPDEIRQLLEGEVGASFVDNTPENLLQNSTISGSSIVNHAVDSLFIEYLEVLQARTNAHEIFKTATDFSRCCTNSLNVVRGLRARFNSRAQDEAWLNNERNTWRLIYCLYQDRLNNELHENNLLPHLGYSEKVCVEDLYKRDSLIRECKMIVNWLESNAHDQNSVVKIDPDAPNRENIPFHDLDKEDEERLCKIIFREIRCGRLEEAQQLCNHCGHPLRAAILEGWKLYHNEQQHQCMLDMRAREKELQIEGNDEAHKKREWYSILAVSSTQREQNNANVIEGNTTRDIWKNWAWQFCQQKNINVYDRATVATFCGCLQALLPVCTSWEDQLWAYMKSMVDVREESEIRDFVLKKYKPLPAEYWNNKMSLEEIFEKMSTTQDSHIREEGNLPEHLIQKYIILDQIPQLMQQIDLWLDTPIATPQFLRFLAHIVLFLRQIGHSQRDDIGNRVLESYVKCLIERNEPQLVAYYTATLDQYQQIKFYANFLENISYNEKRKQALQYGEEAGLNIKVITKRVVESIRNKSYFEVDFEEYTRNLQPTMTEKDEVNISALDWVLFDPAQRAEAISECNKLISYFLTISKIDAAKTAFAKIPMDAIDSLLAIPDEEMPESVQKCIREHLCYKAYLDAHESFNDWFKYFHHSKPQEPPSLTKNANFAEKVAQEHRISQHKAETETWRLTVSHLATTSKNKLYNVLLFPDGGWLNGSDNPSHLRQTCIPEVVLLLYTVLSEMGDRTECIQLADILASEKYKLYKVYTKEKLEDILKKLNLNSCS